MKKTIFALFLLTFCGVLLCGAGFDKTAYLNKNSFRLTRQINADESIKISYVFPVNSNIILENGDENDLKTYKFYLYSYVLALAKQNEAKAGKGVAISDIAYFTDVDGIGFSLTFDDVQAQKEFFGSGESDEKDDKIATKTSGFFMTKTEMELSFPFSKESAESYKKICIMAINSWCNSTSKDALPYTKALDDSVFIYDYASPTKTLKSDQMYAGNKHYHNVFVKTQEEIAQNPKIVFYTKVPNVAVWYSTVLLLVIAGSVAAFYVLKNKPKWQQTDTEDQKPSK